MNKLEIKYELIPLELVMNYFVKGFDKGTVKRADWFVDTAKGMVTFRLYIEKEEK